MSNIDNLNTILEFTANLLDSSSGDKGKIKYVHSDESGGNSEYVSQRFKIPSGTADFTVDLGNLASFDSILLLSSSKLDAVYFSTIAGLKKVSEDCHFIFMTGLNSESIIHINAASSSEDVVVDLLLISNE